MRKLGAWAGALAVFALALAIRCFGIEQNAAGDELYTFFAAKQVATDGSFHVHGSAPYTRASAFTYLIAAILRIAGDSLVAARIPAALFGSLAAGALFWWLRREGHVLAAWIAGILVATSPQSFILSQQVRFYTAQELSFLLGCILAYLALEETKTVPRRLAYGAAAAALIALSVHLQPVSMIGAGGLGLFVAASLALETKRFLPSPYARRLVLGGLLALGILAAFLVFRSSFAEQYSRLVGHADLWASRNVSRPRFYLWRLRADYPFIFMLFPLLVLAAAVTATRITLLALSVFGVALVVHSLLPWKSDRYFEYAMPFFFAIGALGWSRVVPIVEGFVARLERRPTGAPPGRRGRLLEVVVLGSFVVFAFFLNEGFLRTANMLGRDPRYTHPGMEKGELAWSTAAPVLAPEVAKSEVVVTSEDSKTLFYLGKVDYAINRDHVADVSGSRPEFSSYDAFGAPVFYTPQGLARVMACHASGLVLIEDDSFGLDYIVPKDTARVIELTLQPVPLPPEYGIRAFRWETPDFHPAENCPPRPEPQS